MPIPNITCAPKFDNCLNGINLREPVSIQLLYKLAYSNLIKKTSDWNEYNQLENYSNIVKNGFANVSYFKKSFNPYGRSDPHRSLGFHSLRRAIRHTLCSNTMTDIDIENAHPIMLQQLLQTINFDCHSLNYYISYRNDWLQSIINHYNLIQIDDNTPRDIAKKLFITIMYGGSVNSWITKFKIDMSNKHHQTKILEFEIEMKKINEIISSYNPDIVKIATTIKNDKIKKGELKNFYNLDGTVCSYLLQEYEVQILEQVYLYCVNNGFIIDNVASLCADGIMIPTNNFKPSLLNELSNHVFETTGFRLRFVNKSMDEGFTDNEINNSLEFTIDTSTRKIAEVFRALYMDQFIVSNNIVYNYNGIYWYKDTSKNNSILNNFISTEFFNKLRSNAFKIQSTLSDIKPANEDEKNSIDKQLELITAYQKAIRTDLLNNSYRQDFIKEIINVLSTFNFQFDSNPFLFALDNVIFDIRTGKMITPDPTQYISKTAGWSWNFGNVNCSDLNNILETIFPDVEMRNFYLTILSTGICGIQQQHIFVCSGVGGNGKSMMHDLMMTTLGSYSYKLPSTALLSEIKEGPNPAIANMDCCRFVLTCEPSSKKRINSSTVKEITGSKTINVRSLYSTVTFITLLCSLFMECNVKPLFDEVNQAVIRRLITIIFESRFMPESQYNIETAGMSEEEINKARIYKANPKYSTDEFRLKQRQPLLILLMQAFKKYFDNNMEFNIPSKSLEASRSYIQSSDDLYGWFSEKCCADEKKFIYIKDLYDNYTSSEYFCNLSKSDKRTQNLKWFDSNISSNTFISKYYRGRNTHFAGIKHTKSYIAGFTIQPRESFIKSIDYNSDSDDDNTTTEYVEVSDLEN